MGKLVDLTGQRFGRLTVIDRAGTAPSGHALWFCQCDCGEYKTLSSNQLNTGTKSCGCLQRERASEVGMKPKSSTRKRRERIPPDLRRLHQTHRDMLTRCNNPNNKRYALYGGRGITVCKEWRESFLAFAEWAKNNGYNNSLTLDRKDPNGNYCPENCRWATQKEQNNNRRNNRIVEYRGEKMTLHELSDQCGIDYRTLWCRIKAGWTVEDAAERPIRRHVNGHYVV